MTKMPCKDCLIYPICKVQVDEVMRLNSTKGLGLYQAYITVLNKKCDLILDWMICEYNDNKWEIKWKDEGLSTTYYKFIITHMSEAYGYPM